MVQSDSWYNPHLYYGILADKNESPKTTAKDKLAKNSKKIGRKRKPQKPKVFLTSLQKLQYVSKVAKIKKQNSKLFDKPG